MSDSVRSPNPPLGYAVECDLPEAQQIRLVAEFHAHRIRPSRIAYRLGIDIALVDRLVAGEYQALLFQRWLAVAQRSRRDARIKSADHLRGQAAYEVRKAAERDFNASIEHQRL